MGNTFGTPPDAITPTPPAGSAIWSFCGLAHHLRLDQDVSEDPYEQQYVLDLQAAAVEYAETAMGCSLLVRTMTAIFYGPNAPTNFGFIYTDHWRHRLRLPKGPILSGITSVTDANAMIDPVNYQLEIIGVADLLRIGVGYVEPLTVVYQAGYGSSPSDVPADIRQAIRMHVGTMYENRESIGVGKSADAIPHALADFYRLKSKNLPIG